MKRIPLLSVFVFALLFVATGCGASLSQPFSTLKEQPITIYRLQNYEPPPQQQAAAAPAIPPQIQQWLNAGAQLLPPEIGRAHV